MRETGKDKRLIFLFLSFRNVNVSVLVQEHLERKRLEILAEIHSDYLPDIIITLILVAPFGDSVSLCHIDHHYNIHNIIIMIWL